LVEAGGIVTKFWLTITKEEQLKRFREREKTPFKSFKITPEDWRNRQRWDDYQRAVCDLIERTSNEHAPWVVVPANDKPAARIAILKTLCNRLEAAL
jgi:polyphosphate kinase 2 (PPK2 family)